MSDTTTDDTAAPPRKGVAPRARPKSLEYAGTGPQRLARTPSSVRAKAAPPWWMTLKGHGTARMNMMRNWRNSWVQHYSIIENFLMPRRGIFINSAQPTPNTMIRGMAINQNILDPTGTYASRICSAGLMSGLMSPSRQWFKLKPALFPREKVSPDADAWFEECEDRMYTVMGRSNLYQEAAQMFEDLTNFGTGPMLIYEDAEDLIRCYTPCCGEYMLASSAANRVETFGRLFVMTISAIVEMFGLENCPGSVQGLWRQKGGALEQEKIVAHLIEPNFEVADNSGGDAKVPGSFAWREMYWVWGQSDDRPLAINGFVDPPHLVPRWAVTSNDAYGRSVGMDVLPDIIQLQVMTEREAEAIEKQVRPPMVASIEMKNEPSSILPGHITYVNALGPDKGFRPAFEVEPDLKGMMESKMQLQTRIKQGFFNDLFLMLEEAGKQQKTAYEIAQRNQEKLQVLGPVIERLQNEALAPVIKRVFRIMVRGGYLPPLPDSLRGVQLGIEYVGVLALAQKAAKTASLERFAQTMNVMAQANPAISDTWNQDEWAEEYADDLFLSKKIMHTKQEIAQIRQQRAQQAQQQQQMAALQQGAMAAKNLGQVDVGGGMNAVSAMTGLGPTSPTQGNA